MCCSPARRGRLPDSGKGFGANIGRGHGLRCEEAVGARRAERRPVGDEARREAGGSGSGLERREHDGDTEAGVGPLELGTGEVLPRPALRVEEARGGARAQRRGLQPDILAPEGRPPPAAARRRRREAGRGGAGRRRRRRRRCRGHSRR